jgi:hypothetical protein
VFLQYLSFDEKDVTKIVFMEYSIRSDNLIPDQITSELDIKPSRAFAKGEKYQGRVLNTLTKEVESVWRERWSGIWTISTEGLVTSKYVEHHAQYLLDLLEPKVSLINRYLSIYSQIRFYIWWEPHAGHGSYVISDNTLRKLGNLCHYTEFGFLFVNEDE